MEVSSLCMVISRVVTAKSDMHIDAIKLHVEADRSKRDSGIRAVFAYLLLFHEESNR